MDQNIKESIERSIEELKKMQNKFDDLLEDLPDETREARTSLKEAMGKIRIRLDESMAHGEKMTQEAELQAHLGLMEAQDKLEASREVFDTIIDQASERSKTLLDELELKAKLAKMEADDFWEKRGPELTEEFNKSTESMARLAGDAIEEVQQQFSKWNAVFGNRNKG